ncbi:MAG: NAD-dependent epimerase/dehydratase family protein [Candidatus Vogelbacteria bacterium]|nr:NAD-dependent epimerase/dehydratase family protein [Candidatus Vogelbacteria bacterium]
MCMKSLVTGGAGFIGSHIVDKLLELGHSVVVLDDFSLGKRENLVHHEQDKSLKVYKRSICEDLSGVFKKEKFDIVFHLAALPRVQFSIDKPLESHEANINGTLNILEFSRQFGVKRFVFSSSSSIYGDQREMILTEDLKPNPMSPYALHKLTGEYYAHLYHKLYGLETVSLRYFNVFGPRQDPDNPYSNLIPKFIKFAINGLRPKVNGDGEQKRDFTFVADVVNANILAATTKNRKCLGEMFNVGSGKNISVNDITKKIFDLASSKAKSIYGPALVEPRTTLAGLEKSKSVLGYVPQYSLDDGLKIMYNNLINN